MVNTDGTVLKTRMVSVFLTSRCTLNCKYCGAQIPKFHAENIVYDFDPQRVMRAIDRLFDIFQHIDHIDFTGGEPLLTQSKKEGLVPLLQYTARYREQFDFMRVLTNGTVLPDSGLIGAIQALNVPFDFYLDHYEGLSVKAQEFKELCDKSGISYKEILYASNSQYCDGWVDFGDLTYKNYSDAEVKRTYDNCLQAHHSCLTLLDGVLYPCSVAPLAAVLRKIPASYCGGVDLLSESLSMTEKRNCVKKFGNKMIEACHYCNGFDSVNAPRFPAAEQM